MSPKKLLRLPEARSSFDEMLDGKRIEYFIILSNNEHRQIKLHVTCTELGTYCFFMGS